MPRLGVYHRFLKLLALAVLRRSRAMSGEVLNEGRTIRCHGISVTGQPLGVVTEEKVIFTLLSDPDFVPAGSKSNASPWYSDISGVLGQKSGCLPQRSMFDHRPPSGNVPWEGKVR